MRGSGDLQPQAGPPIDSRPGALSRHGVMLLIERDQDYSNGHRCLGADHHELRCPLPCTSRFPRGITRQAGRMMLVVCLVWIAAVYIERRSQHKMIILRQKLVAFLREATFDVVEVGRVSEPWQFPARRGLSADIRNEKTGPLVHAGELGVASLRGVASITSPQTAAQMSADTAGDDELLSRQKEKRRGKTLAWPSYTRADKLSRSLESKVTERMTSHRSVLNESGNRCPLIYLADERTAKKHGLILSEDERKILGTITARLCRCLCNLPSRNFLQHREGSSSRDDNNVTMHDMENSFGPRRARRRLGMCQGEEHASMLDEIMKGANVVVSGDSGSFYEWFASMQDAHNRITSHFSSRSTLGVSEGSVLRTILTGTDMFGDSWFQLEGAGWRPFTHPFKAILHAINFVKYKLQHKQVGPLGKSTYTDHRPLTVTFDGCLHKKH